MTDELLARARSGDQAAFRDLYREHAGRVSMADVERDLRARASALVSRR
ncbi:MAG: hypothetical protein ACREME_12240 [Gemmatimonadales bacterium]